MSAGTFDSSSFPLPEYRNKYVLTANRKPSPPVGSGSFIANKSGSKINGSKFADRHNAISLATWSQLDDLVQA